MKKCSHPDSYVMLTRASNKQEQLLLWQSVLWQPVVQRQSQQFLNYQSLHSILIEKVTQHNAGIWGDLGGLTGNFCWFTWSLLVIYFVSDRFFFRFWYGISWWCADFISLYCCVQCGTTDWSLCWLIWIGQCGGVNRMGKVGGPFMHKPGVPDAYKI